MADLKIYDKTPKTWLQEICAKKRVTPNYDCHNVQHSPPLFECTCVVSLRDGDGEELKAEGYGSNKKDAEQRAAQQMLIEMNVPLREFYEQSAQGKAAKQEAVKVKQAKAAASLDTDIDTEPMSDSEDIPGEPIGELITVCARLKLNSPAYLEEQKKGPENTIIFTITCRVGAISSKRARRSKKQDAKKMAAYRVLCDLRKQGYTVENSKKAKKSVSLMISQSKINHEITSSSTSFEGSVNTTDVDNVASEVETSSGVVCDTVDVKTLLKSNALKRVLNSTIQLVVDDECLDEKEQIKIDSTIANLVVDEDDDADKSTDNGRSHSPTMCTDVVEDESIDEKEQMKIDSTVAKLKRKLLDESNENLEPDFKRKYLQALGIKLGCKLDPVNCLKFVKDYPHIFQHLSSSTSLDEALIAQNFIDTLHNYGGPLTVLKNFARDLNFKLKFHQSSLLENTDRAVLIQIKLPVDMELSFKKWNPLVAHGIGCSLGEAKSEAALQALKILRVMMFTDEDCLSALVSSRR